MSKPSCGVVVMTCYHHHASHAEPILQTWGKDVPDLYFSSDRSYSPRHLVTSEDAAYTSCPEKQINALVQMYEQHPHDWYYFCDDDTFLIADNLFKFCTDLDRDAVAIYGQCLHLPQLRYPSGGAGFLLSAAALSRLYPLAKKRSVPFLPNSDTTIGCYLAAAGIALTDDDRFRSQRPEFYGLTDPAEICSKVSFHYLVGDDLLKLYAVVRAHLDGCQK